MTSGPRIALRVSALQGLAMAAYHFSLPAQFGWQNWTPEDAPTVGWALFALNNYFSFNLLVLSASLAWCVFRATPNVRVATVLSGLLTAFWVFSVIYQSLWPMPLPERLAWVGYLLPLLAVGNAAVAGWPTLVLWPRRGSGR